MNGLIPLESICVFFTLLCRTLRRLYYINPHRQKSRSLSSFWKGSQWSSKLVYLNTTLTWTTLTFSSIIQIRWELYILNFKNVFVKANDFIAVSGTERESQSNSKVVKLSKERKKPQLFMAVLIYIFEQKNEQKNFILRRNFYQTWSLRLSANIWAHYFFIFICFYKPQPLQLQLFLRPVFLRQSFLGFD